MLKEQKYTTIIGKTFTSVKNTDNERLVFMADSGAVYQFYHPQGCCELVTIEDVVGDLNDLVGSPITMAEEVTYEQKNPEGVKVPEDQDSFTWTFYKFATVKGYVTVRWYGASNGYYSESVDFEQVK